MESQSITSSQSEPPVSIERQKEIEYSRKFWGRVVATIKYLALIAIALAGFILINFLLNMLVDSIFPPPPMLCGGIPWLGPGPDPCKTYVPNPNRPTAVMIANLLSYLYIPFVLWVFLRKLIKRKPKVSSNKVA
jgi:hypothetical protein